jgi:hypothetical protein
MEGIEASIKPVSWSRTHRILCMQAVLWRGGVYMANRMKGNRGVYICSLMDRHGGVNIASLKEL